MAIEKFPRLYEVELRFLHASSNLIQLHDLTTHSCISAHALSHSQHLLLKGAQALENETKFY